MEFEPLFLKFWKVVLQPKVEQLKQDCPQLVLARGPRWVWQEYERVRATLKAYMMHPDGRIDRHKVGAALARAIMHVRPLEVINPHDEEAIPVSALFANEILAFTGRYPSCFLLLIRRLKRKGMARGWRRLGRDSDSLIVNMKVTTCMFAKP